MAPNNSTAAGIKNGNSTSDSVSKMLFGESTHVGKAASEACPEQNPLKHRLLPVRGRSRSDLAQGADKSCGRVRIGQRFQVNRSRKLRRLWTEAHLQNVMLP